MMSPSAAMPALVFVLALTVSRALPTLQDAQKDARDWGAQKDAQDWGAWKLQWGKSYRTVKDTERASDHITTCSTVTSKWRQHLDLSCVLLSDPSTDSSTCRCCGSQPKHVSNRSSRLQSEL